MVQLADVARLAGVSKSTASRALSRPDMVSAQTRERVREAAAQLKFRHNPAARALTTGRTGMLGLILPTLSNPYFGPLVLGAQQAAEELDSHLLVAVSEHSPEREQRLAERLAGQVDGLLISSLGTDAEVRRLARLRPTVVLERLVPGLPCVLVDTPTGLVALVEHLVAQGHRHIAYVPGPPGSWGDRHRTDAVTGALEAAGGNPTVTRPYPPTFDAGIAVADRIPRGVTAVIAYNSSITLGLLHGLPLHGRRVPADIALASADDLALLGATTPSITTLDLPVAECGTRAVNRLRALLTGTRAPRVTTLPARLVVRESTPPAR